MRSPSDVPQRAAGRDDDSVDAPGTGAASADAPRFELLYRDHAPRLTRQLRRQLRSNEDARDLVQDAFLRLLGSIRRNPLDHPEAFLNRIVRNLLIDRSRRLANRAQHVPLDDGHEPVARATQADGLELAEMQKRYRDAVATLPERMRAVFLLHRIDELSYKEIAVRLGISTRTAEWHVAEAIVRIGKALAAR